MMEFTYDGMVRYGFGFYNPNHAAALICAIMPFLWGWKRLSYLGWTFSLLLAIPLALTYSRTGILVLAFELGSYFLLTKTKNWKLVLGVVCAIVVIAGTFGVLSRFTIDRAVTNRPEIWLSGLKLYAANPFGVGLGNSGMLASTFLLDSIECRTLINAHLTLFAELGIFVGFGWCFLIVYALLHGIKKPAAWCAFAGLVLSASVASVFDWHTLFDFTEYGQLPLLNFLLAWLTLLFFLGLGVYLAWGKTNWKRLVLVGGITLFLCLLPFVFYSPNTLRVKKEFVIKHGTNMPLVLYGTEWQIKTILPFLKSGYVLPLHSGKQSYNAETVWLFGSAAEYASEYRNSKLIFIAPPEFFEFPLNTKKVFLKRFQSEELTNCPVEYY